MKSGPNTTSCVALESASPSLVFHLAPRGSLVVFCVRAPSAGCSLSILPLHAACNDVDIPPYATSPCRKRMLVAGMPPNQFPVLGAVTGATLAICCSLLDAVRWVVVGSWLYSRVGIPRCYTAIHRPCKAFRPSLWSCSAEFKAERSLFGTVLAGATRSTPKAEYKLSRRGFSPATGCVQSVSGKTRMTSSMPSSRTIFSYVSTCASLLGVKSLQMHASSRRPTAGSCSALPQKRTGTCQQAQSPHTLGNGICSTCM